MGEEDSDIEAAAAPLDEPRARRGVPSPLVQTLSCQQFLMLACTPTCLLIMHGAVLHSRSHLDYKMKAHLGLTWSLFVLMVVLTASISRFSRSCHNTRYCLMSCNQALGGVIVGLGLSGFLEMLFATADQHGQ